MSLRDQIKAANRRKLIPVVIPEWGGLTVYVRTLSVSESLALVDLSTEAKGNKKQLLAIQMASFLCDKDGTPAFTVAEARAELVDQGFAAPLARIVEAAVRENGLGSEEDVREKS